MGLAEGDKSSGSWAARARWWRRVVGPWQPFTGRGVAAFRVASFRRLLGFHLLTALLSGLIVVGVVRRIWLPVVNQGLTQLPDAAFVSGGTLRWPGREATRLAENVWLDWIVTPEGRSDLGQTADLQLEVRARDLRIHGPAGHLRLPYPIELEIPLSRIEATARWGAWSWVIQGGLGLSTALGLILLWWLLATLYTLPALLLAVMLGRHARLTGIWRIAAAALIPGALFADWALLAYGLGAVRLPGFFFLFALHVLIGGGSLLWGLLSCPRAGSPQPDNPFGHEDSAD